MLASDDANTDFMGAHNPDSKLHVRFYMRPVPNGFKTIEEGHPIFEDRTYIEIHTPGSQLNVIDRPYRDSDKARFPLHWAHFQNTHGPGNTQNIGTPVAQWPRLTPAMCEMLKALKFYTVESIAFASDEQINAIGMMAGVAPIALREAAVIYLKVAKDSSFVQKQAAEMDEMKKQMAELQEQLKAAMIASGGGNLIAKEAKGSKA